MDDDEALPDYWEKLEWSRGTTDVRIDLTTRQIGLLATYIGESTSLGEAVRMACAQAIWTLRGQPHAQWQSPDHIEFDLPSPNESWFDEQMRDELDGQDKTRHSVRLPRPLVEDIADVAGSSLSLREAIRLLINQAISDRADQSG